ncbi:MAG: hypothetical protein ACRCXZ_10980, partial [Patescibacteria group bacterium]
IEDGVSFKSRTMPLWFTEVITSIFYSHTFFSDGIIVEMGWNYEFDMENESDSGPMNIMYDLRKRKFVIIDPGSSRGLFSDER